MDNEKTVGADKETVETKKTVSEETVESEQTVVKETVSEESKQTVVKDKETVEISPRTGKPIQKKYAPKKKRRGGNSPVIGDNGLMLDD